ncbi:MULTISPECIES: cytidylyltransferase domain-containing protein [Thalassospira]|jgi:spore coat polysaccharide biosynthesis protein SpsF|uniref:Cytidyltransferase n=1 Tax=Thalassospira povalilytica TaxID=732237 RepID=A0A8I1M9L2_9PROT|nr:glycosyltransferase family protein [Thalassospira povalilytica]MBN8197299.1 glycosyltransferase family protein [Thalassospira povalilytica]MCC4240696.1 glycosyltransferase family protein [Thalassospira povalilytica]PKR51208.1 cytidyltransferase [Thalassospira povalilytica]
MSNNITAIIQARMRSTRLPGKTLMQLAGKPVVLHLIDRVRAVDLIDRIIVAISNSAEDDVLENFLNSQGVLVYRGSEADVLSRFAGATRALIPEEEWDSGAVVRLTADDPVKDPSVMGAVIKEFIKLPGTWDYVCNNQPPWLPEGQDSEIVSIQALLRADELSISPYEREHVTPYFYHNSHEFRCHSLHGTPDLSGNRWTLDTEKDMDFFTEVFSHFSDNSMPRMQEILDLLEQKPEIRALNSNVVRSSLYLSDTGNS